jgi:hypothetical protein
MIDIVLSDGREIKDLKVNGSCLVSMKSVNSELLTDEMLKKIIIKGVVYENITLVKKWENNLETWISLRQKTDDEIWKEKALSDLDYFAMMANIDMEE